jgi:hypothetical protein
MRTGIDGNTVRGVKASGSCWTAVATVAYGAAAGDCIDDPVDTYAPNTVIAGIEEEQIARRA